MTSLVIHQLMHRKVGLPTMPPKPVTPQCAASTSNQPTTVTQKVMQ